MVKAENYKDMSLTLSLNILRALGGDTSVQYETAEEVWGEINKIYDEKKITFDVEQLILNITENGSYEYYPTEEIDAYAPVKINVEVPQSGGSGGSGLDFSVIGYDNEENTKLNNYLQSELDYSKKIVNDYNNGEFYGFQNFEYNDNLVYAPKLDGYVIDNMEGLFSEKSKLKYVPPFPVNVVTPENPYPSANMMFAGCKSLIEVPQLDYQNAYHCNEMFKDSGIKEINIQINYPMECNSMFFDCKNLTDVHHLSYDFNGCWNMNQMFSGCEKLTTIHENFNTSDALQDTSLMFNRCYNLTSIPEIYTGGVTNMSGMFSDSAIANVSIDTKSAIDMSRMFMNCGNLQSVEFINGTNNVNNMSGMFECCGFTDLTNIVGLNMNNCDTANGMFSYCSNLTTLPVLNCNTLDDTGGDNDWDGMFTQCTNLTNVGGFVLLGLSPDFNGLFLGDSPLLTLESITNIINNLADRAANGHSNSFLVLNSSLQQVITEDLLALATSKGWEIRFFTRE